MPVVALALLALSSFVPQDQGLPSEETLMRLMAQAAEARESLQYVMELKVEASQANRRLDQRSGASTVTVAFAHPDKLFVQEQGFMGDWMQLSDGNATWKYDPRRKQYTKVTAGQRL